VRLKVQSELRIIFFISIGAILGATLRYYTTLWTITHLGMNFPYGTMLVNVVGCFILGAFLSVADGRFHASSPMRLFIATGFCGSLTTFSTFSYETINLFTNGNYLQASLNLGISLVLGFLSLALGTSIAQGIISAF